MLHPPGAPPRPRERVAHDLGGPAPVADPDARTASGLRRLPARLRRRPLVTVPPA